MITLERTYPASPEEIWRLWTTKDGIEAWWPPEGFTADVHELDLRLGKDLAIHGRGVTLSLDAFNILNSQTVLQRNVARLNTAASNHITEFMSPRVFRLGARVNF